MHMRYRHPGISRIFDDEQKIMRWKTLSTVFMKAAANDGLIPREAADMARNTPPPPPATVAWFEERTGHDVVAFIEAWAEMFANPEYARFIHRGLTSSDLVDAGHHMALASVIQALERPVLHLLEALLVSADKHKSTYRVGRTHGQWAEPTTWGKRMKEFHGMVFRAREDLLTSWESVLVTKTPGAVGTSSLAPATAPLLLQHRFGLEVVDSGQACPRDFQVQWANALLRVVSACEAIAMEIRLSSRSEVAEVAEGAIRVGSSAMPSKHNPIKSEQVCGLARVARAQLAPIMESVVLHHERDISHSSVERTAVQDLAHLTARIVDTTLDLVRHLHVDRGRMCRNLSDAGWIPYASVLLYTLLEVDPSQTYASAHARVAEALQGPHYTLVRQDMTKGLSDKQKAEFFRLINQRATPKWMLRNV